MKTITIRGQVYEPCDIPLDLAKDAILVQDACNLSGVAHSLSRIVTQLRDHPNCKGTDWVNSHPIVVMFTNKICSLSGGDMFENFNAAYDVCKEVTKE